MFVPLQDCGKEDVLQVGYRAKQLSLAATHAKVPFSLVLQSNLMNEFLVNNNLHVFIQQANNATTTDMQIRLFAQFQEELTKARFSEKLQNQLKECFELVCLDTEKLGEQKKHCILCLQRSTDYEDNDYTTPNFVFSTEKFPTFLNAIKQLVASLFTPASIVDRLQKNVKLFTSGIIITRLPDFNATVEVDYEQRQKLAISSYVGFLDPGKVVHRDEFILGEDFLRINSAQVVDQQGASIFDLDASSVVYKEFPRGKGQSVPNQIILEVGRLAKRIRESIQGSALKGVFVTDGQQVHCISLRSREQTKEHRKTQAREKLAKELIAFFSSHSYPEFASQIRATTQQLHTEITTENLRDALQLSLSIMKFEK